MLVASKTRIGYFPHRRLIFESRSTYESDEIEPRARHSRAQFRWRQDKASRAMSTALILSPADGAV